MISEKLRVPCMLAMAAITLVPVNHGNANGLDGNWHSVDLLGVEAVPLPTVPNVFCFRAWLKSRDLMISKQGNAAVGHYGEVTNAKPVGMPSFNSECKFPHTTSSSIYTTEQWSVMGRRGSDGNQWIFSAVPNSASDTRNIPPRELHISLDGAGLKLKDARSVVDGVTLHRVSPIADGDGLQRYVQSVVQRMIAGDCVNATREVLGDRLENSQVQVACDFRQRVTALGGGSASVAVNSTTHFSRAPESISMPGLGKSLVNVDGVLVGFLVKYSNGQEMFGDAILVRQGARWQFEQFWF